MSQAVPAEALQRERAVLVRFCTRYTGDPDVAEDLAQQTLLEAWRHARELRDPAARQSWLFSIARNACRMWARRHSRERTWRAGAGQPGAPDPWDRPAPEEDLAAALERDDLARLLDGALALLPSATRAVLVGRYVDDAPQAEIAARLGLSEGAVEARLHRGKQTLKRVLLTQLGPEAVTYGLAAPEHLGWQPTRIWCPGCGAQRLDARFNAAAGHLYMRCPGCSPPDAYYIGSELGKQLMGIRSLRPAIGRVLESIHQVFRVHAAGAEVRCPGCGAWQPIMHEAPPWHPESGADIYRCCPQCGSNNCETWHSLTWSLPAARQFWRENPRMRFLPARTVEAAGGEAVVTGFASLTGGARLEVVTRRATLQVLQITGATRPAGGGE